MTCCTCSCVCLGPTTVKLWGRPENMAVSYECGVCVLVIKWCRFAGQAMDSCSLWPACLWATRTSRSNHHAMLRCSQSISVTLCFPTYYANVTWWCGYVLYVLHILYVESAQSIVLLNGIMLILWNTLSAPTLITIKSATYPLLVLS